MAKLLSVKEAAREWGISEKTVWQWKAEGRFAFHKLGKCVKIPSSEIMRVLEEGFVPARRTA